MAFERVKKLFSKKPKMPQRPDLKLIVSGAKGIMNGASDMAENSRTWMFPAGEIEYSVISKVLICGLTAILLIVSVNYFKYVAVSWWLNIFGIGAGMEWLLNIGPKIDKKFNSKVNYWTLGGALIIYASFTAISMIIHKVGWQWTIFIAGVCYWPDAGAYLMGGIIMKVLKIKPWPIWKKANPGKSWQALLFGALPLSMTANMLVIYPRMPKTFLGVYGAAVVVFLGVFLGAFGDLFESWTKRQVGVKDSSILLGPMGGFLDRIDSLLATSILIIVAYVIQRM